MKRCKVCGLETPLEGFPANKRTSDKRGSWCKQCVAKYYKSGKGKAGLDRSNARLKAAGYFRFGKGAISILRQGAKKRNLPFALTADTLETWWRQTPDQCAYCGISTAEFIRLRDIVVGYVGNNYEIEKFKRIFKSKKHAAIAWLTIDRVDNSGGYATANMVKCCWFCNALKGSLLMHEDIVAVAPQVMKRLQACVACIPTPNSP